MIKQPHSSNAFIKFYYRPYGFRALFTANALGLYCFIWPIFGAVTIIYKFSETVIIITSAVLTLCIATALFLKKPKVYVSLTSDGFQYRSRGFFPKDCRVKYSDICAMQISILSFDNYESVNLEIITKNKKEHSFPREFFNKKSDFEDFRKVVIKKISPSRVPNIHTSSLDHTGSSIAEKCEYDKNFLLISNSCNQTLDNAEEEPENADEYAQQLLEEFKIILKEISDENKIAELKNMIATTVIDCIIQYSMETWKWQKSLLLCQKASTYAISSQIKINLKETIDTIKYKEQLYKGFSNKFDTPSLKSRSDGFPAFGFFFYGKYNKDSKSNTYVTALYILFFFIPVFPLSRYRVSINVEGGYNIYAKGSREPIDFVLPAVVIIAIIILVHIS